MPAKLNIKLLVLPILWHMVGQYSWKGLSQTPATLTVEKENDTRVA